jgi:hypothetical protein
VSDGNIEASEGRRKDFSGAVAGVLLDAGKFEMFDVALRRLMLACVLVLAATLSGSAKTSRTSFDGAWSVLIITDAGTCERSYR